MANSFQNNLLGVIVIGISVISIELIPISRQAAYWNRCLDRTIKTLESVDDLKGWNEKDKESLAVGICNGAVYEPKFKK